MAVWNNVWHANTRCILKPLGDTHQRSTIRLSPWLTGFYCRVRFEWAVTHVHCFSFMDQPCSDMRSRYWLMKCDQVFSLVWCVTRQWLVSYCENDTFIFLALTVALLHASLTLLPPLPYPSSCTLSLSANITAVWVHYIPNSYYSLISMW